MYAIIETGGKQFRVEEGQRLDIQKLTAAPGATADLESVLLVGQGENVKIGAPYVSGAKVSYEVVDHGRGEKIIIFKKRRRQDSARKRGHRQDFTTIRITSIQA